MSFYEVMGAINKGLADITERIEKEIREGDIVQLRSGGPKMMVEEVGISKAYVSCSWMDNYGQAQQESFPYGHLKKMEDD